MGIRSISKMKIKKPNSGVNSPITAVAPAVPDVVIFDRLSAEAKENVRQMYIRFLAEHETTKNPDFWSQYSPIVIDYLWKKDVWLDRDAQIEFSSSVWGLSYSYDKINLSAQSMVDILKHMQEDGFLQDWNEKNSLNLRFFNENNVRLIAVRDGSYDYSEGPKVQLFFHARKTADSNVQSVKNLELEIKQWLMQLQKQSYKLLTAAIDKNVTLRDAETWLHQHKITRFKPTGELVLTQKLRTECLMLLPYLVIRSD